MKIALLVLSFLSMQAKAEERFFPLTTLELDNYFSHHVIVAEKSTHQVHLFENVNGRPRLIKSYQMASGKMPGDKMKEGDFKTPEGIYYFEDFMTKNTMLKKIGPSAKIYGAGAFVSNYPNEIDRINKKKGTGIWLHSTNDETRIDKGLDSRGCVVMMNKDLVDISKYIELKKTPFIITQNLNYLNEAIHEQKKNEIDEFVQSWLKGWKQKDINEYMSHYDPDQFVDTKGNFQKFKLYKTAVFGSSSTPKIEITHRTILVEKDYAVVTFIQSYQSNSLVDQGRKMLYLQKNSKNEWKIIREVWSADGIDEHLKVAFEPKATFFNN